MDDQELNDWLEDYRIWLGTQKQKLAIEKELNERELDDHRGPLTRAIDDAMGYYPYGKPKL